LRSTSVWNDVRMVELLVIRHAKSDWGSSSMTDFDRPLSRRGQRAADMMAAWLDSNNLEPDRVVSSAAIRARTTAECVVNHFAIDTPSFEIREDLMTTAAIAHFSFDCAWPDVAPGASSLISLTRPAELDS